MSRKKGVYLTLLIPIVMITVYSIFLFPYNTKDDPRFEAFPIITGAISIIGLFVFCKYKPYNVWLLPISFMLSPLLLFIYEFFIYESTMWYPYVRESTFIVIVYYSFPFFIISLTMAIIATIFSNIFKRFKPF